MQFLVRGRLRVWRLGALRQLLPAACAGHFWNVVEGPGTLTPCDGRWRGHSPPVMDRQAGTLERTARDLSLGVAVRFRISSSCLSFRGRGHLRPVTVLKPSQSESIRVNPNELVLKAGEAPMHSN